MQTKTLNIKKYTNLLVGDSIMPKSDSNDYVYQSDVDYGYTLSEFVEKDDKLYIVWKHRDGATSGINLEPHYEVSNWKRYVKPAKADRKPFRFMTNFKMNEHCNDYELYKTTAEVCNSILSKPDGFSVSKIARNRIGQTLEGSGSAWYNPAIITHEDLQFYYKSFVAFQKQDGIDKLVENHNIRRITKAQALYIAPGTEYSMMYVSKRSTNIEVVKCKKLYFNENELNWHEVICSEEDICTQNWSNVGVDGSFIPDHGSVGNEDGYLYMDKGLYEYLFEAPSIDHCLDSANYPNYQRN